MLTSFNLLNNVGESRLTTAPELHRALILIPSILKFLISRVSQFGLSTFAIILSKTGDPLHLHECIFCVKVSHLFIFLNSVFVFDWNFDIPYYFCYHFADYLYGSSVNYSQHYQNWYKKFGHFVINKSYTAMR